MASGTRSKISKYGSKADDSPLPNTYETSPTQKPKSGPARTVLNTILEGNSQSSPKTNVSPLPATTTNTSVKRNKRKFDDDESDHAERAAKTHVVNTHTPTPSRSKRKKVIPPTKEDSYESATRETQSYNIEKVRFASVGNIVANEFLNVLLNKDIKARKADMQGFEMLEVDISNRQTAVRWKNVTERHFPWLRIPDTATLDECSVFAVVTSTKGSFEKKAVDLFKRLQPSMVLVLHQNRDRTGAREPAIVGCWMNGVFRYCDSLAATTADRIAEQLSGTKEPLSWYLEMPGEGPSKREKVSGSSVRILANNDPDTDSA
jgi:hypothetical protein